MTKKIKWHETKVNGQQSSIACDESMRELYCAYGFARPTVGIFIRKNEFLNIEREKENIFNDLRLSFCVRD